MVTTMKGNKKVKKKVEPMKGRTAAMKIEKALKKVRQQEKHG